MADLGIRDGGEARTTAAKGERAPLRVWRNYRSGIFAGQNAHQSSRMNRQASSKNAAPNSTSTPHACQTITTSGVGLAMSCK